MALRFFAPAGKAAPNLQAQRLDLRVPSIDHYEQWATLRHDSQNFLRPWEPEWASDELTRGAYRRRIRRYGEEIDRDESYPFFLFLKDSNLLVGGITLGHLRRGVAQAATIGYWMGERFAGQGLMREALELACAHGFSGLGLHRLEAACVPDNERSRRLLLHAGFREEGYARSYLKIAGEWRDHLLFARLADDVPSASAPVVNRTV
jgi:[ribosomal protein S5]-alanine N-acetyltransferase